MSTLAVLYMLEGAMPSDLFSFMLAAPLGIAAAAFQDWVCGKYFDRVK